MPDPKLSRPVNVQFPDFGVFTFESHHSQDFYMPTANHDFAKILFVIDGRGDLEHRGSRIPLVREVPIYIPAFHAHRITDAAKQPLSLYMVCIAMNCLPPTVARQLDTLKLTELRNIHQQKQWYTHFRRLLYEQTMNRSDRSLVMLEIVLWMLAQITRYQRQEFTEQDDAAERVNTVIRRMATNFFEPITLQETASQAKLSERRFSQLFRAQTNDSWLNYLRNLRINHACHLLKNTDRSVTAIAFESGFSDLSNFYRAFKQTIGKSPLEWRNGNRMS